MFKALSRTGLEPASPDAGLDFNLSDRDFVNPVRPLQKRRLHPGEGVGSSPLGPQWARLPQRRQHPRPDERSLSLPPFLGIGHRFVLHGFHCPRPTGRPGRPEVWSGSQTKNIGGLPAFLSVSCPSTALR